MFVRVCHLSLSWTRWIQPISFSPVKIHFNIILSPMDKCWEQFFSSCFPTKTLYTYFFSPCVVCPAQLLNLITWIFGEKYKSKVYNTQFSLMLLLPLSVWETKLHTDIKQQQTYCSAYCNFIWCKLINEINGISTL